MVATGAIALRVPVDLSREEAQVAARKELAKQMYQAAEPGLLERAFAWFVEELDELLDRAAAASPGGYVSLVGALVLVAALIVAVRLKVGPLAGSAAARDPLFVGGPRSAKDHRAAADAHAAAGEWALAVRERLRAIIRSLEERGLLEPRPGRTADEAAAEAGRILPPCADGLRAAARTFDDVWYGGRVAGIEADRALRELDERVQAARPTLSGAAP